jgi:uncharacterized membrane protein HdeD (DUF308 family)
MLEIFLRSWWVLVLRGLFAILFGLIAIVWPDVTVFVIVTIMGAFLLLDGLIEIWVGFLGRGRDDEWWTDALLGIAAVIAGVVILAWPGVTAVGLMVFIGAVMTVYGAMMIYQAVRLRADISNEWLLVINGALSLVLGIAFMIFPGAGAVSLVWMIGIYIIVFGILLIMVGWKMRGIVRDLQHEAAALRQEPRYR